MIKRNGFVSNSSSSSFIFIVKKELHDKVYETLSDYQKSIIAEIVFKGKMFGFEFVAIQDLTNGDSSYLFEDLNPNPEPDDGNYESAIDAYYKYKAEVQKRGEETDFYYSRVS